MLFISEDLALYIFSYWDGINAILEDMKTIVLQGGADCSNKFMEQYILMKREFVCKVGGRTEPNRSFFNRRIKPYIPFSKIEPQLLPVSAKNDVHDLGLTH